MLGAHNQRPRTTGFKRTLDTAFKNGTLSLPRKKKNRKKAFKVWLPWKTTPTKMTTKPTTTTATTTTHPMIIQPSEHEIYAAAVRLRAVMADLRHEDGRPLLDINGLTRTVESDMVYPFEPLYCDRKDALNFFAVERVLLRLPVSRKREICGSTLSHLVERLTSHYAYSGLAIAAAYGMGYVTREQLFEAAKEGLSVNLNILGKDAEKIDPQKSRNTTRPRPKRMRPRQRRK
jgi:hypothetical protein